VTAPARPPAGERFARRVVTGCAVLVVAACFGFSFGNVLALGRYLAVPELVAWLVAPAVDLTVVGLIVGVRYLSLRGVAGRRLRPARAMLVGAGLATWALNTAHALFVRGHLGVVAYDSLAPLLLVGWAEVGPWFLRQFRAAADPPGLGTVPADRGPAATMPVPAVPAAVVPAPTPPGRPVRAVPAGHRRAGPRQPPPPPRTATGTAAGTDAGLLAQARAVAAEHEHAHGRPVSRDALRRALRVSNQTAGALLHQLRADPTDPQPQPQDQDHYGGTAAGTTALAPAGPGAPPERGPAAGDGAGGPRTDLVAALVPSPVLGRDGQEGTGDA
jgi:hypothetical protein